MCLVCSKNKTAEINSSHLMFDNLRNILNADFKSVKVSLSHLEGIGYNFVEDYINCPNCFCQLPKLKTFYFLLEEK
jgi:hypothetical protein